MTLLDDTRDTLTRLAGQGWQPLFDLMGIDPASPDLREHLLTPIDNPGAVFDLPGFEELAGNARRAIEPGHPARSILYHALASPAVATGPDGTPFAAFPTPLDLDRIENLVFGIRPPDLGDIMGRFAGRNLAVGVFSREYREKSKTTHSRHADLIFARNGIARVGTLPAAWDGSKRAFSPFESGDDIFAFRTLPCRYAAYIAVQMEGNESEARPYKFDRSERAGAKFRAPAQSEVSDADHVFWVPVHKLFSGTECLLGQDLQLRLIQQHFNEKLRRIHTVNMGRSSLFDSGFSEPQISAAPFKLDQGVAEFLTSSDMGPGVLNAVTRPSFVEPTELNAESVGAFVPSGGAFDASFNIAALDIDGIFGATGAHRAPEFMHVRSHLRKDGTSDDLNRIEDVDGTVNSGRVSMANPYKAQHYSDFTGDGWVIAEVEGAPAVLARNVPAYSIVAAPDFYPYVNQSEVLDWSLNVRSPIRRRFWRAPPLALCDQRIAPNLALLEDAAPFVPEDKSATAMVGLADGPAQSASIGSAVRVDRTTYLPDGAAGFYAPGWDTSIDFNEDHETWHLAAHGLGSPFPEDAKLCAAISAFWPAVAPDSARSWGDPQRPPIAPMVDSEIGLGGTPPWDGIPGPRIVTINGREVLENDSFDHVDYVKSAIVGSFTMSQTMLVDQDTYQARVLATHRLFNLLAEEFGSSSMRMASFEEARATDSDLTNIRTNVIPLAGRIHRYLMVETDGPGPLVRDSHDRTRWLVRSPVTSKITVYVDEFGRSAFSRDGGLWQPSRTS